ncbi:hypothetical protein [Trueperella sp. LYQ143]|uniref:hypothetical protein n=1 Tax=Trueperella sp. LYQ143 TaxID=3391059 RepID=UPI003983AC9D
MPWLFDPLTPSPDDAQQWAEHELAKAKYDDTQSILAIIARWIGERFTSLLQRLSPSENGYGNLFILIVVGIAAIVILYFIARNARSMRKSADAPAHVALFDDMRNSHTLFRAADAAEQSGDLNLAVIERYRGIIRLLDERGIVRLIPGMTPLEAASAGAQVLGHGDLFNNSALYFNDIYYWKGAATPAIVTALHQLHTIAARTEARP